MSLSENPSSFIKIIVIRFFIMTILTSHGMWLASHERWLTSWQSVIKILVNLTLRGCLPPIQGWSLSTTGSRRGFFLWAPRGELINLSEIYESLLGLPGKPCRGRLLFRFSRKGCLGTTRCVFSCLRLN